MIKKVFTVLLGLLVAGAMISVKEDLLLPGLITIR